MNSSNLTIRNSNNSSNSAIRKETTQLKTGPKALKPHQKRHTDGKEVYEKMLHIIHHQGNAN